MFLLAGGAPLHAQSVIQFSALTYYVTEGAPEVAILVHRTNDLDTVVSVDFATTTNGTATAGADYGEMPSRTSRSNSSVRPRPPPPGGTA